MGKSLLDSLAQKKTYTTTGQVNQGGGVREGLTFSTFTREDRPGMVFHEYVDPKSGERHVFGLKAGKNSLGA